MFCADDGYYRERAAQDRYLGDINWDDDYHDDDYYDPEGWYDGNPPDDYWDDNED